MDFKDYKRIKVNGEFRDVVQTAPDEPRFRSNGMSMVFDESNLDVGEIDKQIVIQNGSKIEFYWTPTGVSTEEYRGILNTNIIGSVPGQFIMDTRLTADGQINVQIQNDSGTNKAPGQILPNSFITGIKTHVVFEVVNNETVISTNNPATGFQSWSSSYAVDWGICTVNSNLLIGKRHNSYSNGIIEGLTINGETFDAVNYDATGTVTSSDGSSLDLTTKHPDGTSYVLNTMIQKTSFALATSYTNVDYLTTSLYPSTFGDVQFKARIRYDFNNVAANTQFGFLQIGGLYNNSLNINIRQNNTVGFTLFNSASLVFSGSVSDSSLFVNNIFDHEIELNGGVLYIDGVQRSDQSANNSFDLTTLGSQVLLFGQQSQIDSQYIGSDGIIYGFEYQNTNDPLTEGLGLTTNGANINTNHADGIKRVNSHMWLKNGNVIEFDSSNSDYLEALTNVNWTDTTDCDFSIDFEWSGQTSTTTYITIGNLNSNGVYVDVTSSGVLRFRQYNSSGSDILFNVASVINGRNQFSISGGTITLNGTNYTPPVETLNIVNGVTKIAKFFTFGAWYDLTLYGFKVDDKTFQFREGQGTTTTSEDGTTTATLNGSPVWKIARDKWINYG